MVEHEKRNISMCNLEYKFIYLMYIQGFRKGMIGIWLHVFARNENDKRICDDVQN